MGTVSKVISNLLAMAISLFNSGVDKSSCLIGPIVKVILETTKK
jgi:hypothetical protein